MKRKRQLEELTKLQFSSGYFGYNRYFPDYFQDHNPLQHIVNEMDSNTLTEYHMNLVVLFGVDSGSQCLKATCKQKIEAILKTYDKWEEK